MLIIELDYEVFNMPFQVNTELFSKWVIDQVKKKAPISFKKQEFYVIFFDHNAINLEIT